MKKKEKKKGRKKERKKETLNTEGCGGDFLKSVLFSTHTLYIQTQMHTYKHST